MLMSAATDVDASTLLLWSLGFVGFGGLSLLARAGYKRYRAAREKVVEAWGDLFGRDAVKHPNTDEIILPATEGIGLRLTMLERGQDKTNEVLSQVADTQAELVRIHHRIDEQGEQHELLARDFEKHLDDELNERRQRATLRAETEQRMWQAIEAIAGTTPPEALVKIDAHE